MNEKESTLQLLMPKAVLKALTPEAKSAVPQGLLELDMVRISQFPFKVGRESRIRELDGKLVRLERTKFTDEDPSNDLYLTDAAEPLHISREHFEIKQDSLSYMLIDRHSACGTSVGGNRIGGRDSGGRMKLEDGDIIAVGAKETPYLFKFITL